MKLLYMDCFAGISGDMLLGALLNLGVPQKALERELRKLELGAWHLHVSRGMNRNVSGVRVEVHIGSHGKNKVQIQAHAHPHEHAAVHTSEHRMFSNIRSMIQRAPLTPFVKKHAVSVFHRIALAEGKIHGLEPDKAHFHEVGAVDSIVDIVGGCVALEALGVDAVQASPMRTGFGFVDCEHGRFPVPAMATLEILKGVPIQQGDEPFELVTPTGAAMAVEFCQQFGPMPPLKVEAIGYGLGKRELSKTPNVLRAIVGETSRSGSKSKKMAK